MNPERWQRIREVFHDAWALSPEERPPYLCQACGADTELRAEVEALLEYESSPADLLSKPLHEVAANLIPHGAQPAMGRKVGAYRLVREIGRGGMGTVYEAVRDDEQFHQRVAIKLLRAEIGSEDFDRRFRQERQILAVLSHTNIAKLLDGGITEDGQPFFVMEYVDGLPIEEYCRSRQLSITQRLKLFQQVCSAVHYAHQNLVVHRDLKPSNILVTDEGTIKLLDFGIAKLLHPDGTEESAPVTRTGLFLMTPEYASPEQVRGLTVTTATDVYSLGVILYELLTGSPPYRLKSRLLHELGRIVCEEEPAKPSTTIVDKAVTETGERSAERLRRRLSGDLDNIVLMALRKEPHRRYPSVDKFADDIEKHLNQLPVAACADTWSYRAAKFLRRNHIGAGVAGVVALSLIAGVITTTWQARIAERNRRDAVGRQLAAQSERLLAGGDPSLATLLAVEASRHLTSLETDQALRHALRVLPRNKVIVRRKTKIVSMAISPDGHWLAEAGEDGVLAVHDAQSGELTITEKLGAAAEALAFDPASRRLGAGGADGSVLILDMTQPSARIVKKFEGAATAIAFDPTGTMAVIATANTKLVLARSADLTEQNRLDARGLVLAEALAFSPDGKWIAAGSSDGYLYVWEARTGTEHLRLTVAASGEPEQIGVNALQFSADGKTPLSPVFLSPFESRFYFFSLLSKTATKIAARVENGGFASREGGF
ncbi:MAG: protein kinase [Acidobacteriia bacterium]|nr:protein kinase [Terriglobia bacterium]